MTLKDILQYEINGRIESNLSTLLIPRLLELNVDYGIRFDVSPAGPLRDMALDLVESRYLLTGSNTGVISIHDTTAADTLIVPGQITYPRIAHVGKCPDVRGVLSGSRNLSPVVCLQWYPVDSGMFCTASVNKQVRIWDTNKLQCVDIIELPESVSWIALSDCSRTHNLIAASLGPDGTGRAVLVDPLISAIAVTLPGGHSQAGLSQVCWSPRSTHLIITSGFDGRVLFWDIRSPRKPVYSLDRYFGPDTVSYSHEAAAHTGPVLGLVHSPDGMHLFTWGGAGASENILCLRMWSSAPGEWDLPYSNDTDSSVSSCPRLRPVNFGVTYADNSSLNSTDSLTSRASSLLSRGSREPRLGASGAQPSISQTSLSRPQWTPVRLSTTWCPSEDAWGARAAFVFAPCRSRLLIALATRQGAPSRLINRHYSKIRACVWNQQNQELYTCGMDGNLFTWPLFPSSLDNTDQFS